MGPAGSGGKASTLAVFSWALYGAMAYRISVGSLSLVMLLGIFFLSHVPDTRPERTVDEPTPVVR